MSQTGFDWGEQEPSSGAALSIDGLFRFMLWRRWAGSADKERTILFIGLNPSTADATVDDPTVRKWMHYAKRDGFGRMYVCNLSAFRATNPEDMKRPTLDHRTMENRDSVLRYARASSKIVCCWGAHGSYADLDMQMKKLLIEDGHELWRFDVPLTANGQPRHPLYLKNDCPIVRWETS